MFAQFAEHFVAMKNSFLPIGVGATINLQIADNATNLANDIHRNTIRTGDIPEEIILPGIMKHQQRDELFRENSSSPVFDLIEFRISFFAWH